jgi:hypothetical protein
LQILLSDLVARFGPCQDGYLVKWLVEKPYADEVQYGKTFRTMWARMEVQMQAEGCSEY